MENFAGTVKNNLIAGNKSDGAANCSAVVNNTIAENKGHGVANCTGIVKNNILASNGGKGIYGPAENSYNCFWQNAGGNFYNNYAKIGDFYANPLFAAPGSWSGNVWTAGDYGLRSQYGRWDAASQQWVADSQTSPCIDAGDPADGIGFEPNPNGGRINVGFDGGMVFASKSSQTGPDPADPPAEPPVCLNKPTADLNNDCKVNLADIAIVASQWLACGLDDPQACGN